VRGAQQVFPPAEQARGLGLQLQNSSCLLPGQQNCKPLDWYGPRLLAKGVHRERMDSFCSSCILPWVDSEGMFSLAGLIHLVLRKQESKFSCSEQ
jgi:hypothetical protein